MSCSNALEIFINKYLIAYRDALSELPRYYALGEDSACIQGQLDDDLDKAVFFTPFKRKTCADFHNVEHALSLSLHGDIHPFYGQFYSAPLMFTSEWGEGELLQAWNQQDFEYLQQNMIGHLMMKKKQQQDNPQLQSTMEYNTDDVYELEEFCRKHNIIGFNCGRMNPKSALRMLKSRMGVPIEEATPAKIKSLLKG